MADSTFQTSCEHSIKEERFFRHATNVKYYIMQNIIRQLLGYNNYIQFLYDRIRTGILKSQFPNKIKKKKESLLEDNYQTIILDTLYVHFVIKCFRSLGENPY